MGYHHHHTSDSTKNIRVAFFLNFGFMLFEIAGGIYTNSVAILSDALHDLGDSLSLGISWYLDKKSKQKSDSKFSYGYQRFSLLGALINGVVLFTGSIFVLTESIPRLMNPEHADAKGMILISIVGIIINGLAVLRLRKGKTLNEKVVGWHLLEDVLGWVAVFVVSVVLLFWDIPILDPILSIVILGYILLNVGKNMKETFKVFLQGVPSDVQLEELQNEILKIKGVLGVHQIQLWSLDGEKNVFTIHVEVNQTISTIEIIRLKKEVRKCLKKVPIMHATIEFDFSKEEIPH